MRSKSFEAQWSEPVCADVIYYYVLKTFVADLCTGKIIRRRNLFFRNLEINFYFILPLIRTRQDYVVYRMPEQQRRPPPPESLVCCGLNFCHLKMQNVAGMSILI